MAMVIYIICAKFCSSQSLFHSINDIYITCTRVPLLSQLTRCVYLKEYGSQPTNVPTMLQSWF